jgi:outer membrane lipoprotein-sorting protein
MSVLTSRPVLRWIAPAAIAATVLGGGAAVGALRAAAEPNLAPRSAAQLLVDLQTARLDGFSGTVVQRSELGLPALPGLGSAEGANLATLIAGTHTLRLWYAGPDRARVALLSTLAETDIIRNGRDLWVWNSRANTAEHTVLPEAAAMSTTLIPQALPFTPQQIADAALAAINPSTVVTTDGSARIAGRDAYELVLAPRDTDSLVAQVRLAIDAREHLPLRVQILARDGGVPAFEVAFTQISFTRPDPEQFTFNPPPGAKVEQSADRDKVKLPDAGTVDVKPGEIGPGGAGKTVDGKPILPPGKPIDPGKQAGPGKPAAEEPGPGAPNHVIVGQGWTAVLVMRSPKSDGDLAGELGTLLQQLPRTSGGRLLTSRLFTFLLTDDGRLLVGAVSPARLAQVAADPAARLGS